MMFASNEPANVVVQSISPEGGILSAEFPKVCGKQAYIEYSKGFYSNLNESELSIILDNADRLFI